MKAAHVMSRVHEMRGGRDNDPNFGTPHEGQGLLGGPALKQRFDKACERIGMNQEHWQGLNATLFTPPPATAREGLSGPRSFRTAASG